MSLSFWMAIMGIGCFKIPRANYFEIFGAKRKDNHKMVSKNG